LIRQWTASPFLQQNAAFRKLCKSINATSAQTSDPPTKSFEQNAQRGTHSFNAAGTETSSQ